MTKIMHCSCHSEFQDETYGRGNRVFNETYSGTKVSGYRCTVCGKETR